MISNRLLTHSLADQEDTTGLVEATFQLGALSTTVVAMGEEQHLQTLGDVGDGLLAVRRRLGLEGVHGLDNDGREVSAQTVEGIKRMCCNFLFILKLNFK